MSFSRFMTVAAVAGFLSVVPVLSAQAQLFNNSNNSGGSSGGALYNGGGGNSGGAQPLFLDNHSSSSRSRAPSFATKPKTVNKHSNGFDRTLNRDTAQQISDQDRRIAEAAMQRMAKAEALKAAIAEDTARKRAAEASSIHELSIREDRQFGADQTGQPEMVRPQVYDDYRNNNPAAPSRLFNSTR